MRRLEKRIANLERRFHCEPVILQMPDGTEERIVVYSGNELLDLLLRAARESEAGVGFSPDLDVIRRSISGGEKGGHMIEFCRAVLNSPATPAGRAGGEDCTDGL